MISKNRPRLIAFYLPQYHPIPENDEWWGKGFTEWSNVVKAKPLFKGHYQPHLPADLGFYDLRVPEVREHQGKLAKEHGIDGFCYYHYWFNGKQLLERPFEEVLESGKPDFPFCLCWANENWTRKWDGQDQDIIICQDYSEDDDLQHIEHLLPAFQDSRYIKINGRPLVLIYRVNSLPNPQKTAELWRNAAKEFGFPDLYLCTVISLPELHIDPASIGFDAAVDFVPDWKYLPKPRRPFGYNNNWLRRIAKHFFNYPYGRHYISTYLELMNSMLDRPKPSFKLMSGVTVGWDNSPRRKTGAKIFDKSDPEIYGHWLKDALLQVKQSSLAPEEQFIFINAWNEWGEGAHLEPDAKWGKSYLETTLKIIESFSEGKTQ